MKKIVLILAFLHTWLTYSQSDAAKEGAKHFEMINSIALIDGNDLAVYNITETMYNELLQPDMGSLSETTINKFKGILINNRPNKNILEMLMAYQDHVSGINDVTPDADYQLMATETMINECLKIYGKLPALLRIYRGEALMAAERYNEAMTVFTDLLQERPDCIPAKIYIYQLTPEGPDKEKLGIALKTEKPNHWLVKETVK